MMHKIAGLQRLVPALIFAICVFHAEAQSPDTLSLSVEQADRIFLDSNFQLIASHYNVDAQHALIEQARLWDNPVLSTDQIIASQGSFFPYGHKPDGTYGGQYYIQLQQLFKTAGKRAKQVNMAVSNARISEWQLQDLVRNLRYQLHTDLYTMARQLENKTLLESQLDQATRLFNAMDQAYKAGSIALKDRLRIEALVVALQQDLADVNKDMESTEAEIRTLLRQDPRVFVRPTETLPDTVVAPVTVAGILDKAFQSNPYYQLQQEQITYQQYNLSYQKALRAPDLTIGPDYDRSGSVSPNYVGLGISLPLPVFNHNQGNIKNAAAAVKQQEALTLNARADLQNKISAAYEKLLLTQRLIGPVQRDFFQRYGGMFNNILNSYQAKQIGLLEFLDFFNDYIDLRQKFTQLRLNLVLAKEELNYNAGTDVIK